MSGQLTLFYQVLPCCGRIAARDAAESGPGNGERRGILSLSRWYRPKAAPGPLPRIFTNRKSNQHFNH
jgi:hypothetical protein